ncbi:MAG: class I SAM-dependent methyltransferase [Actinomycetota bacterium]|nr:class I SAM-dependent methyltransferase [Actinomycetota bacterium]
MPTKQELNTLDFWADYQPGFRSTQSPIGSKEFFEEVSTQRSLLEPHIPEVVGFEQWKDRAVLEAGCGIGTDGARFAAAGAHYTGVDFSPTALRLARLRFEIEGHRGRFTAGSVTHLPFPDRSFDLVFSHGVIHHVPDTTAAVREFYRVLKPGGRVLVMVYHRRSFNYYFSILLLRRVLIGLLLVPGAPRFLSRVTGEPPDLFRGHRELLSEHGARYLGDSQLFLSHNTDGPGNPLSKVFSRREITNLFSIGFDDLHTEVRYLNVRLYPGGTRLARTSVGRRLERRIGWHLYITGSRPRVG